MSNAVITSADSFVSPSPKSELDGAPGLDLHEIARSLGAKFSHVKHRFEELSQDGEICGAAITAANESNGLAVESFVLTVDDAKFLVTQYANAVGRAYCRWLIQQEREWSTVQQNLADPDMAMKFGQALIERAQAQIALRDARAVVAHVTKSLTTSQVRNGSITRENNRLKAEVDELSAALGDAQTYKTVRAMAKLDPSLTAGFAPPALGRRLSQLSREMGYDTRDIPDAQFGSVKAYHAGVWRRHAALIEVD